MINLKNYIIEGIFDTDEDTIDKSIKDQIKQFLKDNFKGVSLCKISRKPNKDGKLEVLSNGNVEVKNKKITSLTNGSFVWTNIKGDFICDECNSLTSLKGAPKEVKGSFYCYNCDSLTSLKGAPKEVWGDFNCYQCGIVFTTDDVEKVSKVRGKIQVLH